MGKKEILKLCLNVLKYVATLLLGALGNSSGIINI